MLISAPTGIAWSTVPFPKASPQQQLAEQTNICNRVTAEIDAYCNQVLRSTIDIEERDGPDYTITVSRRGARMALSRWPILSIISAQYCGSAVFPRSWITIPTNMLALEYSTPGVFGSAAPDDAAAGPNAMIIAPGYLDWSNGRNGWRLQVTYVNGWPHCGLTQPSVAGATSLQVDDCTGWANIIGTVYDGDSTESATVLSASATTGPGTLTLSRSLTYAHPAGRIFTALPGNIQQAAIFFAMAQALTRGTTATTVQSLPGSTSGGVGMDVGQLKTEAERLCDPWRRVAVA